jgi:uncharacterized protein
MSHSIAELRQQSPMWYFERNYIALMDMISAMDLIVHRHIQFDLAGDQLSLNLAEETRYTLLLNIRHRFSQLDPIVPELQFDVRVYLDARLAEVIAYQGIRYLLYKYPYPNKGMHHRDEKRQTNLMLFDWLCACSRLNYRKAIINTIKPTSVPT